MPLAAWGDESFHEHPERGVYVLAAAVLPDDDREHARQVLLRLRGRRRTPKLHFHEMDRAEQRQAAKSLADLDGLHVVVLAAPVPPRRQERARAQCLTRLVTELHSYDVDTLYLEARAPELNTADVRTVAGARQSLLPAPSRFRVEHRHGAEAVELWAADIVAGVCRAAHDGRRPELREALAERIYDIHIAGP